MVARQFLIRKVVPVFLCFVLVFMLLAVPMQTKAEALAIEAVGGIVIAVIALAVSTLGYTFTTQGGFRQACQNLFNDMDVGLKTQIEMDVSYDSVHERLVVRPDAAFWSLLFEYVKLSLGAKGSVDYGNSDTVASPFMYAYSSVLSSSLFSYRNNAFYSSGSFYVPESYYLSVMDFTISNGNIFYVGNSGSFTIRSSSGQTLGSVGGAAGRNCFMAYVSVLGDVQLWVGQQYTNSSGVMHCDLLLRIDTFISNYDNTMSVASSADYSVSAGALPGGVVDDGWTDWTNAGSDEGEDNPPIPAYIPIPNTKVFDDVFGSESTAEDAMTATQTDTLSETGVLDFIDTVVNPVLDNYEAVGELAGEPVHISDLFPFCIPFDIYHMIQGLQHNREAPSFEWRLFVPNVVDYTFNIDLSSFDSVALLLRSLELLLFCVGLAMVTRSLLRS